VLLRAEHGRLGGRSQPRGPTGPVRSGASEELELSTPLRRQEGRNGGIILARPLAIVNKICQ
jgi:hypothetical protein